ncbi:bifunctional 5,10-methylenetetrahydrofolate dehydrogenase/5,10-methenyltetrahydrofolate cyclohydrolase [Pseudomonas sp. s4]|uniref:bifunctional 5,10-methylenetetrahydrofolate dehydrogenase/5,10-methenyltetrahydrofolate cyclohydrolase n=1 Tax=Pseudomonas sp. s4 TaxID=353218 RepID=UPI00398CF5DC
MNIDGKQSAVALNLETKEKVDLIRSQHGITPALAVVLVGQDPASQVYVRNKVMQAESVGMVSIERKMSADTTTEQLLAVVNELNNDPSINGILVQLPLPKQIEESLIIEAIAAEKDVDGFHEINSGRLLNGDKRALVPCTPQGCVILAKKALGTDLRGMHAVVIGRSNIVGKPLGMLLLRENCSVTIVHSHTRNIEEICKQADILFVAVGRANMVKASWVKPGATVIDVGINRIDVGEGRSRLVGDVDFEDVAPIAAHITPVPGGVGPMTIACLLKNTIVAACNQNNLNIPFE